MSSFVIDLEPGELAYLAALLRAPYFLGVPNPFRGWLPEDVAIAHRVARANLARRSYLLQDPVRVVQPVIHAVRAACSAKTVFVLRNETTRWYLYLGLGLTVELERSQDSYRLCAGPEPGESQERLRVLTGLAQEPAAPERLALPYETLQRARSETVRGSRAGVMRILQEELSATSAAGLAEGLARAARNGSLLRLERQSRKQWSSQALGYLAGPAGLWELQTTQRDGRGWVIMTPSGAIQMKIKMAEWLGQGVETKSMILR